MEMETDVATDRSSNVETPDLDFDSLPLEDWIDSAEEWVRENRTLALLGSFAVGVFVGVMMRD